MRTFKAKARFTRQVVFYEIGHGTRIIEAGVLAVVPYEVAENNAHLLVEVDPIPDDVAQPEPTPVVDTDPLRTLVEKGVVSAPVEDGTTPESSQESLPFTDDSVGDGVEKVEPSRPRRTRR